MAEREESETKRAKTGLPPPPDDGRCTFEIASKGRYCNQAAVPNQKFCLSHCKDGASDLEDPRGKRVPCPIDPTHDVFEKMLRKHVKVCPKKIQREKITQNPWHQLGINAPSPTEPFLDLTGAADEVADFQSLHAKLLPIYTAHFGGENPVPTRILEESEPPKVPDCNFGSGFGNRHLSQQASIVENMRLRDLLRTDLTYVELGCGKGGLTWRTARSVPEGRFVMVDREKAKGVADKHMRNAKIRHERLRQTDLLNLDLNRVAFVNDSALVGMSKHLCGGGTDVGIRCMLNYKSPAGCVAGLALATCCHHACSWDIFVGKSVWVHTLGLTRGDFETILKAVGWGVGKFRAKLPGAEKPVPLAEPLDFEYQIRADTGKMAKLLIDFCRREFLKTQGFESEIVYFCDAGTSPENVMILAWQK